MDAVYVPGQSKAQIGGDWYNAFALPNGRVVLLLESQLKQSMQLLSLLLL